MIHMISSFDLKEGHDIASFTTAYAAFVSDLETAGIIASAGPLGSRVSETPMDTDTDRTHQYFSVLSFHDRDQLDAAYAYIVDNKEPGTRTHLAMYRQVTNAAFTCWQDMA